jgi:hypothetical protein
MSQVYGVLGTPSSIMMLVKRPRWGLVSIMSVACVQTEFMPKSKHVQYTFRT